MQPFSTIQLTTPRLMLRPLQLSDAESLLRIYGDPEFARYWSTKAWVSLDQATTQIEKDQQEMSAGNQLRLGIFLRSTDQLIGTCSLFHFAPTCRRAEVGYGIDRAHWRQGYMHEAVSALLQFAFVDLALNRIEADIDPRNTASARSLQKLGFQQEGFLRERWIVGEEVSDSAIYGLLAREWQAAAPVTSAPPVAPS